jgi:isopentenyl diphosphate isomerase/L-lactate dehydrogenase-like FMN-dependent dehydrogenase
MAVAPDGGDQTGAVTVHERGGSITSELRDPGGDQPLNVADYEAIARSLLPGEVYDYFAGGSDDELTLTDSVRAYDRWRLRPRTLVDVSQTTTRTSLLGLELSMPVLVAPTAFQRMAHPDGELAMARAAAAAGTVMAVATLATASLTEIAAAAPDAPRFFQLSPYRDEGLNRALLDEAVAGDVRAILLTVDTPGAVGRRERDLRNGLRVTHAVPSFAAARGSSSHANPTRAAELLDGSLTWSDLERFAAMSPLPLLVKGVLRGDDALRAHEHGAAGVVVSTHGGRQLDGAIASLDALPDVVESLDGRGVVLVDGGVRRGTDVLKALALGADAVMVGRPPVWGLAAGGERGAAHVLELLREELRVALVLSGCTCPADVTWDLLARAPGPVERSRP